MRVLVTGSSGCLARALLPALLAHPRITAVTGVDCRDAPLALERLRSIRADLRNHEALGLLAGHDALVHLGFVVLRGRRTIADMRSVNVDASIAWLRHAHRLGLARIVHLSSAAIYGGGEALSESAPLAPHPGFQYAAHKAELESWLARSLPAAVSLRPHAILGPNAQPLLKWLVRQRACVALPDPQPLLQAVHEDDVARAVIAALDGQATGAFNLAAPQAYSLRALARARHRLILPIPRRAARSALSLAWRLTGFGGEPAWIDALQRPLTLDCRRARDVLGWTPRVGNPFEFDTALSTSAS
jgi:nucleoside-diphosphate-sugar epimerase